MTKVSPGHAEMTAALAPPSAPLLISTHRSPSRSPTKNDKHITDLPDVLRDKERRVKEQLDRCAEQRGRKMEEQKRREERRRNAAEERRRQQQEAEKERLEAMVRRRGGRGGNNNHLQNGTTGQSGQSGGGEGQLDNRPKRWTWGGPPDSVAAIDFLTPSDQPINKQLSNSSAALHSPERASSNNHRLHRSLSNRRSIAAFPEETKALTPTGDGPTRSSSFRGNSKGPATPKRVRSNRSRPQSPCSPSQYPPSPRRHKASTPGTPDAEVKGHISTLERKTKTEGERKIPKSTSRELNAESPMTPSGRSVGGTTDAEEASRVLAERRRLARIQKEQEEKQRLEEERLRAEEEERRRQERQEQQERQAREAEDERVRREQERREREDQERRQKEQRWKDMQQQLDKEREEAFLRAQKEAERKRLEREQMHIQEEQERQQRKKRIEEIMKRTRKSDVEAPSVVQESEVKVEAAPPSGQDMPLEPSVISLGPLEKSCVDELSDGVQSMDVSSPSVSISPVSREEQPSAHDFSPVTEADAIGWSDFSKLQPASSVGDLNKNLLLQACSADAPPVIPPVGPKLDVQ
ncbi:MAP7 domain-containing protein 2 isoform X3 [Periophthalmus magnuspinnatus]|uniref:MAP7 domain-containing protein 2 isoform X3 n=1 Tax=Periophthalmus magnuspinnatus TaxID=409849 RepID=UPI0024363C46|nr:MAP7 domain-containing protein 2 isoform X3 [Periophthalmus magnuspinnatus]